MYFIIGLGNPEEKYFKTRHNVGFLAVDYLASQLALPSFQLNTSFQAEVAKFTSGILVKPQTYMNESGKAVRSILDYYDKAWQQDDTLDHVFVIHDDLDIEVGKYKIQLGTGPKVHNGLTSIYQHLHRKDFWHVRLGVDGRQGNRQIPSDAYVLSAFSSAEQELITTAIQEVSGELQEKI